MEAPRTIHDFGRGYPRSYSKCNTQRRGAQSWRTDSGKLLQRNLVELDHTCGPDHATWTVLSVIYPQADVPVVQLSMDASKPGLLGTMKQGRALRSRLGEEGFLILGSGTSCIHWLKWSGHQGEAPRLG